MKEELLYFYRIYKDWVRETYYDEHDTFDGWEKEISFEGFMNWLDN